MNLKEMSTDGLRSLHEGVRKALWADDHAPKGEKQFGVREHPDWKRWSDELEGELRRRGERVEVIGWGGGNT